MTIELVAIQLEPGAVVEGAAPHLRDGDVLVVHHDLIAGAAGRPPARVLRRRDDVVVVETAHGFVCRDVDNRRLPVDPDREARRIRDGVRGRIGVDIAVIVVASFDRPWRRGRASVAIGCAGIAAVHDGVCVADGLAAAAALASHAAAVVRGVDAALRRESSVAGEIVRPAADELFR